jgi:hypothetical protein
MQVELWSESSCACTDPLMTPEKLKILENWNGLVPGEIFSA